MLIWPADWASINRWHILVSRIFAGLQAGGKAADNRVERNFYQRAVGYERLTSVTRTRRKA